MPNWVVTGKLGAGKSLMSVGRIQKYLLEGRRVATNLTIYPEHLLGIDKKHTELYRLPDIPTIDDFLALPLGYEGDQIDESKNGLLVLDECGIFLDSRGWNNPQRKAVNAHFKLLRKLRWDVLFLIQDIDNFDSDARRSLAEHVVYCRRMDRMKIPFVSSLVKLFTGYDLPLPRVHLGIVLYGTEASSMKVDQWSYYGDRLYKAYDTEQLFSETVNHSGVTGLTTVLPSWYTHGRYLSFKQRVKNAIRDYKVKRIHFFSIGALVAAFTVNALVSVMPEQPKKGIWSCNEAYVKAYGSCEADPVVPVAQAKKDLPGKTVQDKQTPDVVVYMSGWQKVGKHYQVTFVDDKGAPYYPTSYNVKIMGDCVASMEFEGVIRKIICMPDSLAYQPIIETKDVTK